MRPSGTGHRAIEHFVSTVHVHTVSVHVGLAFPRCGDSLFSSRDCFAFAGCAGYMSYRVGCITIQQFASTCCDTYTVRLLFLAETACLFSVLEALPVNSTGSFIHVSSGS